MKKLKLCALIAAAGKSTRMGSPKALIKIQGEPAAVGLARKFSQSQLARVFITVPKFLMGDFGLEYLLADMPVEILLNRYDSDGYAGSVRTVIEKLDNSYDGIIITPVDAPFMSVSLVRAIISTAERCVGDAIIVPKYYVCPGHPVYFSKDYFLELKTCFMRGGLKSVVANNHKNLKILYWPDRLILANLNSKLSISQRNIF